MQALAHAATVEGGFRDPVFEAQTVFAAAMNALARPGMVQMIDVPVTAPEPLDAASAALILSLCDQDTPVWLDANLQSAEAVAAWIGFHTGAPLTKAPPEAAFAIIPDAASLPAFEDFNWGRQDYPDRSTTLIVRVASLDKGRPLVLAGPGIKDEVRIAPSLPDDFANRWAANRAAFPRGVDLLLVAPDGIVGLPRSVRIKAG